MRNLAAGSSRNHAEEIVRDAAVAEAGEDDGLPPPVPFPFLGDHQVAQDEGSGALPNRLRRPSGKR
jgi:hypothetical protein